MDIQQQALLKYKRNMDFLQRAQPQLHKKLQLLDEAIRTRRYKERFALEYLPEGYFDLLDLETKEWLYGKSSLKHAKELAAQLGFSKNEGVIETFYNYRFEGDISKAKESDPAFSSFVTTAPVIEYLQKITDKRKTTMKEVYKFIFFGVGLGVHLPVVHEKIKSSMYLIVEDNLEIFRLSLFVTDYAELAQKSRLFFSVMEDTASFKTSFESFFYEAIIRNNYIKYALFYGHYADKIKLVQNFIVSSSHLTYPHDRLLLKNRRVLKKIAEETPFLNLSKRYDDPVFTDRPVILVAAGPSLQKNIEWLRQNADKATIVAAFMTSVILEKEGIVPDIVVHVDEQTDPVLKTIERMKEPEKFFSKSIFLLAPSVDIAQFREFVDEGRSFFFEDRTRYRYEQGHLEGYSVGEISYAISLILGAKEIYLLGLDLALDPETGQTHAKDHVYNQTPNDAAGSKESVSLRGTTFEIPGNFREKVSTTPLFLMSIHRLNHFTKELKRADQRIFNLCDGARYEDIEPLDPEQALKGVSPTLDKEHTSRLHTFFDSNSSSRPSMAEAKAMDARKEDADRKRSAIEHFLEGRAKRIDEFENSFARLSDKMIEKPTPEWAGELSQIMVIYLANIGGWIGDFINTKEIENPKRHTKQLQKIVAKQFEKLLESYDKSLKEASDRI